MKPNVTHNYATEADKTTLSYQINNRSKEDVTYTVAYNDAEEVTHSETVTIPAGEGVTVGAVDVPEDDKTKHSLVILEAGKKVMTYRPTK